MRVLGCLHRAGHLNFSNSPRRGFNDYRNAVVRVGNQNKKLCQIFKSSSKATVAPVGTKKPRLILRLDSASCKEKKKKEREEVKSNRPRGVVRERREVKGCVSLPRVVARRGLKEFLTISPGFNLLRNFGVWSQKFRVDAMRCFYYNSINMCRLSRATIIELFTRNELLLLLVNYTPRLFSFVHYRTHSQSFVICCVRFSSAPIYYSVNETTKSHASCVFSSFFFFKHSTLVLKNFSGNRRSYFFNIAAG